MSESINFEEPTPASFGGELAVVTTALLNMAGVQEALSGFFGGLPTPNLGITKTSTENGASQHTLELLDYNGEYVGSLGLFASDDSTGCDRCYEGVFLSGEEIREIKAYADFLDGNGWSLPEDKGQAA